MAQEIGDLFDDNSTRMKQGCKGMAEDMDFYRSNVRARKRSDYRFMDVVKKDWGGGEREVKKE